MNKILNQTFIYAFLSFVIIGVFGYWTFSLNPFELTDPKRGGIIIVKLLFIFIFRK